MNDPAEVERRERESREYVERYERYVVLREGLAESTSTMRASFPGARDLTEVIATLAGQPAWPVPVPMDARAVPLASQPFTSAITTNAPPVLSVPSGATG